jgi:hypothetical protein
MQADLCAVYDALFESEDGSRHGREELTDRGNRRERLLALLGQAIHSLALTRDGIDALPANYALARTIHPLPDLLENQEWLEVEWNPDRLHEQAVQDRRATRVFIKPRRRPGDVQALLDDLGAHEGRLIQPLDSVALLTELLLLDRDGEVTPSHLTYDVQIRRFAPDSEGRPGATQLVVYELSRKRLISGAADGGLTAIDERAPAYLPAAGNDYSFVSPQLGIVDQPRILVPMQSRCESCHGVNTATLFTFAAHVPSGAPVRQLVPSDDRHARDVAARRMRRASLKALREQWGTDRR